jgi:hypothetical protein
VEGGGLTIEGPPDRARAHLIGLVPRALLGSSPWRPPYVHEMWLYIGPSDPMRDSPEELAELEVRARIV